MAGDYIQSGCGPPATVRRKLRAWYRSHQRKLPWRRTRDPYRIWVSEVMLQQTQVATVIPYYRRFLRKFPTLPALARASPDRVLAAWSGLGYYRRARNLHAAAREVLKRHRGRVPEDPAILRRLPGVGGYTAGAIASIAFHLPEPALDGNSVRVLCRLLGRKGHPRRRASLKPLERAARDLLKGKEPGTITQALMELGALVCLPASPRCGRCPLRRECRAFAAGRQDVLPGSPMTRSPIQLEAAVAVVRRGDAFLMVRRGPGGLMGGLWELPGDFLREGEDSRSALRRIGGERLGVEVHPEEKLVSLRQTITYRRVKLEAFRATVTEPSAGWRASRSAVRWVRPEDLSSLPHGAATRRILREIRFRS